MYKWLVIVLLSLLLSIPNCWARLRDPTRPPGSVEFDLSAIMFSSRHQTAIINQQTVQAGDTTDGYRVREIKADKVIMEGPDGLFTIPLETIQVKSPVLKR